MTYVVVEPGKTMNVDVGGSGRPMIGHVEVKGAAEQVKFQGHLNYVDHAGNQSTGWEGLPPDEKYKRYRQWRKTPEGRRYSGHMYAISFQVGPDGTFHPG
jgi:hypothetical protein